VEAWLDVSRGGVINQVKFYGDFFGQRDVSELEAALAGCRYAPSALQERLEGVNISHYFVSMPLQDLLNLLY